MSIKPCFIFTCSMTSGAIQHGVPTNVFLTLFRVTSPPVAKNALTPKSETEKKITLMLCKTLLLTKSDYMNMPFPGDLYSSHDLPSHHALSQGYTGAVPPSAVHCTFENTIRVMGQQTYGSNSSAHQSMLPTKKVPKVWTNHKWLYRWKLNTFPKP